MSTPEQSPPQPLPRDWVERIWSEMRATYGAAFDRQWECPASLTKPEDIEGFYGDIKAHWAKVLAGFSSNPKALRFALDNLPPHPPNLVEFRALCIRRPEPQQPQLPAPKADPEKVAKLVAGVKVPGVDPKAWAYRLRDKEAAGAPLTLAQRDMWRAALRTSQEVEEVAA